MSLSTSTRHTRYVTQLCLQREDFINQTSFSLQVHIITLTNAHEHKLSRRHLTEIDVFQVTIKVKSRHVGGAFSKNNKCKYPTFH